VVVRVGEGEEHLREIEERKTCRLSCLPLTTLCQPKSKWQAGIVADPAEKVTLILRTRVEH